jgi:hypothetical protein
MVAPVYNIAGQWSTGLDSSFVAGIQGAFACTGAACPAAFAAYDAKSFLTSSSLKIGGLVQGTTDTTTNPTYQGNVLRSNMAAFGIDLPYDQVPGFSHAADCHIANLMSGLCFPFLMHQIAASGATMAVP